MPAREYARHALLGIGTPQSNPVVEAEFSALQPNGVGTLTTRLTGEAEDPKIRFHQFLENLDKGVSGFGKVRLDAFGFACTATTKQTPLRQPRGGSVHRQFPRRWRSGARWTGLAFGVSRCSVPIPVG